MNQKEFNAKLEDLAVQFYQQKDPWDELNQTMKEMLHLLQQEENAEKYMNVMKAILSAIQEQDGVMVADLINFELLPLRSE